MARDSHPKKMSEGIKKTRPSQATKFTITTSTGGATAAAAVGVINLRAMSVEEVISFLLAKRVNLTSSELALLRKEKLDGRALSSLTVRDLFDCGFTMGTAGVIMSSIG